ncbi:MAG: type I-E CRISPR-associated protein Cas6/Cse3/CasE [Pseudonocardiaceae bacterium]
MTPPSSSAKRYWHSRPIQAGGYLVPSPCPTLRGRKRGQERGGIVVESVRYDGHLLVTDRDTFATAILNGIGRAKAYGCGLLSLAPMRSAA